MEWPVQTQQVKAGTTVAFKLADVVCPDFQQVVEPIGPELAVAGDVAFISDNGVDKGRFAIIEVKGVHSPLIVPVEKLNILDQGIGSRPGRKSEFNARAEETAIQAAVESDDRNKM